MAEHIKANGKPQCTYSFLAYESFEGVFPCCKDEGHEGEHLHFDEMPERPDWLRTRVWPQRSPWYTPNQIAAMPERIAYMEKVAKIRKEMLGETPCS